MPQLPEKPNRFRRGDSNISASRLNQIVGLIPRQIKGGGDSKISYFGDRPVVQSPPETGQLGATEIQNYISTAVVVAEYDNCLLCTVFNPPIGDPLILPDDSEVAGPGGPNFVPQTYDDALGDSTSNTFKVQFYVAKPYLLQRRPWDGAVVSYNGRSAQIIFGGNTNNLPYPTVGYRELFDAESGNVRLSSEVISPSYQKGEVLVILRCGTGYSDKNGMPIIWMDQNTGGRRWEVMPRAIVNPTSYYPVENYAILPKAIGLELPAALLYPAFIYSSGTPLLSFLDGVEGNCWLMMLNNEPADVSRYYDCSFAHFADDGLPVYLYAGAPPYVVRRTTPGEPIGPSHALDMAEDPAGDDIPSPYGDVNASFFSNGIFINICTDFALPGGSAPATPDLTTTNAMFAYVGAGIPGSPYGDIDSGTIEGRLLIEGYVIESNGIVAGEVTVGISPAPYPTPGNDGVRNKMHYADARSGLHVQVGGLYVGPVPEGPLGSILLTQSQAVWYIDPETVLENIQTVAGHAFVFYSVSPTTPGTGIVFQAPDGLTPTGPKISLGGSYMADTVLPSLVTILVNLGLIENDTTP